MTRREPAALSPRGEIEWITRSLPKKLRIAGFGHERQDVHGLRFRLPRSRRILGRLALSNMPVGGSGADCTGSAERAATRA
jgi:hypothetical protein